MEATFYIASAVAIIATLLTITRLNAVHALLYLIVSLLSVAMVFYTLGAPFVAALMTPTDRTFVQGFILVDIPVGGDWVTVNDPAAGTTDAGRLEDATLLHVDVAVGRWLFQGAPGLVRGLAGVVEFHYSPMVSDPGVIDALGGGLPVTFGSAQRLEYADLTVGLHAQLGNDTTLRVGGAFPLRDRPDRTFDAELLVQVVRFLR